MTRAFIIAGAVLLSSCASRSIGDADVGTDAGVDAGTDAGTDVGPGGVARGAESVCNCSTLDCAKAALASPDSVDCGLVWLQGDTVVMGDGGEVKCAIQRLDPSRPFSVTVKENGVDTSDQRLFVRRDDGSSFEVRLQIAASLNITTISASACSGFTPIDPVTGDAGTQSLSCDAPSDHPTLPCH